MKITTILITTIFLLMYGCGESPQKSDQDSGIVYTLDGEVIEEISAYAGSDITALVGETIEFDASKSNYNSNEVLSYEWRIGDTVLSTKALFEVSNISEGEYIVILTIVDSQGISSTDSVIVKIVNDTIIDEVNSSSSETISLSSSSESSQSSVISNQSPTANAGADTSVNLNTLVTLDASKSSDTDGSIVSYEWKDGTTLISTNMSFSKSDFSFGIHNIILTVTDNNGKSTTDTVIINVLAKGVPIAKAGSDISSDEHENIILDASQSSDSDGIIVKYEWKEGTTTLSTDKTFTKSDFSAGIHTIVLHVEDDRGSISIDTIKITIIANHAPIANAGSDQSVSEGTTVSFDASTSSDTDGTIANYTWSEGNITLSNNVGFSKSDFTMGVHTIILTVVDNDGAVSKDTISVNIIYISKNIHHNGFDYVSVKSPYTGKIWLDRNLGASHVCGDINDEECYGDYYQWGRESDGHEKKDSPSSDSQASSLLGNSNAFFLGRYSEASDWIVNSDARLRLAFWREKDGSSICPVGYSVPTIDELKNEFIELTNGTLITSHFLKIPLAGSRSHLGISTDYVKLYSMTVINSQQAWYLNINVNTNEYSSLGATFVSGIPVRCIKN